jgi:subtilisin family serine protease
VYTVQGGDYASTRELLEQLAQDESVERAFVAPPRDQLTWRGSKAGTGKAAASQWHDQIGVTAAKQLKQWQGTHSVSIGIVDTGFDTTHVQLQRGEFHDHFAAVPGPNDPTGHGTHVSGLIGATTHANNQFSGLAPESSIWAMHRGIGPKYEPGVYYRALRAACAADVVNLSLGGEGEDSLEADIIRAAVEQGAVVVAAAGNDALGGSPTTYPAALDTVFAVGAVDESGARADFSNEGEYLCVCAPGVDILSTVPTYPLLNVKSLGNPPLGTMSGTSMAAPIVTSTIARMLAYDPALTRSQIDGLLKATGAGVNSDLGRGVIDVYGTISGL